MKLELPPDSSEFLRALISHRVRFVIVGGHAVAAWAEPRLTLDLDILVGPTLANARRLRRALVDFGFGAAVPRAEAFLEPGKVWMLGRKPQRIDILTSIDGVTFGEVWRGRVALAFDHGELFVIGREALLANKRASGRPKDLADVDAIERLAPAAPGRRSAGAGTEPSRKRKTKPEPKRRKRR